MAANNLYQLEEFFILDPPSTVAQKEKYASNYSGGHYVRASGRSPPHTPPP